MIIRNQRQLRHLIGRLSSSLGLVGLVLLSFGCEVDNYMDPSKTGYFEFTPTTMPILTRLDAIESLPATISDAEPPTPDDLLPSSLQYRLAPGDVVRVEIDELKTSGQKDVVPQSSSVQLRTGVATSAHAELRLFVP